MNLRSALDLIQIQAAALFVIDADGRLRYINEPGYPESELKPAPRFFMGRTLEGNIWRFRYDLPDALVNDVEQLCRTEPVPGNFATPPQNGEAIRAALHQHAPITQEYRGPAYWIPDSLHLPGNVSIISAATAHLLEAHFPWALEELEEPAAFTVGPLAAVIEQGNAVSICFCARRSPWAAEAGVETAEAFRGRGFACAAVSGWASAVRQLGLVALYSTWWENSASQRVARKLGMVLYGEDWSIT